MMIDSLKQDILVGARTFRRAPAFTLAAVATLALGIGLSTAMFSVSSTLLLRRLPVHDQDRVVVLWGESRDHRYDNVPLDAAHDFARATRALSRVAFLEREGAWPGTATVGDQTIRPRRALVSGEFFDVLGAKPILGRALRADDDVFGAAPVAVLSYGEWTRQFGGDPHVIGRHLQMLVTGFDLTIVGVMPQGLDYPRGVDFWTAVVPATTAPGNDHSFQELDVIGRLAPDASTIVARDELTTFFRRPGASEFDFQLQGVVHTLPALVLGDVKPAVLVFSVAVALLLLITCINVANLLLIRGIGRAREMAVRAAVGASRLRIVRQLLTESAMLAMMGGVLGAVIAAASLRMLVALAPADVPRLDEIHIGATTFLSAMGIAVLATLFFGVAPSLVATRRDSQDALRAGTRQSGSRRTRRATETLIVGQIALALAILSAAGLVIRSLLALEHVDFAFNTSQLTVAEVTFAHASRTRFDNKDKQLAIFDRLLPRVRAIPGVDAATPVALGPFTGAGIDFRPAAEGQSPSDAARNPFVNAEVVSPEYFATLGIALIRGRAFTDDDRSASQPVAVVNQSVANRFWPGQNPIGKRFVSLAGKKDFTTVVGVAPDTRYRDLRDTRPTIYIPLRQSPFPFPPTALVIRARVGPAVIAPALRAVLADVEPGVQLTVTRSFDEILAQPLAHPRLNASLLAVFALSALALATVGLFAVMTTMVRQRTAELGVRMALGATSADIARLVVGRGAALAGAGIAAGLCVTVVFSNFLRQILYDVTPLDPPALAIATGALLAVATLATMLPARASARIDPVIALRRDG